MQDFRKVRVWQAARELTVVVYRVTAGYPRQEQYGLTSQMRRSALSIGANLAEGCGRGTDKDLKRFVQVAFGSSLELLHHLIISADLGFLTETEFQRVEERLVSVRKMLAAFIKRLAHHSG